MKWPFKKKKTNIKKENVITFDEELANQEDSEILHKAFNIIKNKFSDFEMVSDDEFKIRQNEFSVIIKRLVDYGGDNYPGRGSFFCIKVLLENEKYELTSFYPKNNSPAYQKLADTIMLLSRIVNEKKKEKRSEYKQNFLKK